MNNNSLVLRIATVAIAVLVVGGIIWAGQQKNSDRNDDDSRLATNSTDNWEIEAAQFETDSDEDGLYDWEESLWGTDSKNPDSDGDGTPDGEEIDLNRDPRIPGPDDALAQESLPIYARTDVQNLNVSESFQKDYFDGLLGLRQKGNVSKESLDQMLTELTSKYLTNPEVSREYTLTSIHTLADESTQAVRTYANQLGRLTLDYQGVLSSEDILAVLNVFVISKDETIYAELASLIQSYAKAQSGLANIPVPANLSAEHLGMLNGIATMRTSLSTMHASAETDPLASIIELSSFRAGLLLFTASVEEAKAKILEKGISFSNEEPARNFLEL